VEPEYGFEPLGSHNRAAFSCGDLELDRYFRERAAQDQRRNVTSCFVLADRSNSTILGYYTLSAGAVALLDLPAGVARRLPRYPNLPAILLGRLAVDQRYQGVGFGRRLLVDALSRARNVTSQVGAVAVVVDAKNEAAAGFYERFGFARLPLMPLRLYLPIASILTA